MRRNAGQRKYIWTCGDGIPTFRYPHSSSSYFALRPEENYLCASQRTAKEDKKETARNDSCVVKIVGYRGNRVVTSIPNLVTCGRFSWEAATLLLEAKSIAWPKCDWKDYVNRKM
jgi:hypothetical protein